MNAKRRKIVSSAICIVFLFVTFAAFFYIAKVEKHHCTGEKCDVCACVHQAEQVIKNSGTGMAALVWVNPTILSIAGLFTGFVLCILYTSLVSCKVRMDN